MEHGSGLAVGAVAAEGKTMTEIQLFRDDVVQSVAQPSLVGMVLRVGGEVDSDSESSDSESKSSDSECESSDSEDDNEVAEGAARVCWMNSEESTEKVGDLKVIDRALLHGDIVTKANEQLGQTGTVVNVETMVDLELPNGDIMKDVNSRRLRRVRAFYLDDYVIHNEWLGRVDEILDNVTVLFDDGSKCKVMRADPDRLRPLHNLTGIHDSESPFFQGQKVRAVSASIFKSGNWLKGRFKASHTEGTVVEIEAGTVFVDWIAERTALTGGSQHTHRDEVKASKLLPIIYFSHTEWQLGDRSLPPTRMRPSSVVPTEGSEADRIPSDDDAEASFYSTGNAPLSSDYVDPKSCFTGEMEGSQVDRISFDDDTEASFDSIGNAPRGSDYVDPKSCFTGEMEGSQVDGIPSVNDAEALLDSTGNAPRSLDYVDAMSCGIGESCSKGGSKAWTLHDRLPKDKQQRRQARREKKMQNKEKEKPEKMQNKEKDKPVEYALLVVKTRSTVDVVWQDGKMSQGVDACALVPVKHLGDHEFWPQQYVMERALDREGLDDGPRRVGVVQVVDAQQRMASVRWLKHINRPEEPREFESEELMSVYELVEHPDYAYCLEDVVIRLTAASRTFADAPTAEDRVLPRSVGVETTEAEPEDNDEGEASRQKARESIGQRKTEKVEHNPPSQVLSWVGVIIGLQDGDIEVAWADGTVSKVGPQAIWVVERDPEEDSDSAHNSDLEDAEDINDAASTTGVFDDDNGRGIQDLLGDGSALDLGNEEDLGGESSSDGSGDRDDEEKTAEEHRRTQIKQFDCVKDPLDHHYISETGQPTNQRKWVKKIQQEWGVLEKNLPDMIFVRVFEERMDLLRAVIVGAKQTPYHDGLFVFDVYMPPDYPIVPPVFYYHSGGLRLNPNMYENGTVCLSLLNTWSGRGSEIWHPSTSSILQVLLSIQGLVLNEKPYFNEAGYDKQVGTGEGERNSALYNETSFLLSCKSMLYLLRRPPMQLEDLVRDHFQKLGPRVLLACKAYLAGAEVGSLTESDLSDVEEGKFGDQSSAGFKVMLEKLVPKLAAAFAQAGAESSEPPPRSRSFNGPSRVSH